MGNSNYDIRNKIFTYVKHSADITDQIKEIYESSLIFIGDEQQIYVPIIDTYVGVGKSKYNELANSLVWIPSEGSYSITTKYGNNRSLGTYSISSGRNTVAIGDVSFASGINTIASGEGSHAEGTGTITYASYSHAEGLYTYTYNNAEHAEGKYNKSNNNTISSIGIGEDEEHRKNAFEVLYNGNAYLYGVGNYTGDNLSSSKSLQEVINRPITQNGTVNNSGSHVINNISINSYGDLSYTYHNLSGSDSGNFLTGYTQSADGKISVSKGTFTTSGHNKTSEQNYIVTYTYIDSTGKIHYDYRDLSGSDSGNFITGYTQTKDGKISVSKGTFTYAGTDKGTTAQSHVITDLNIDSTGKISYNYRDLSGTDSGNFLTEYTQSADGKISVSKGTFTTSGHNKTSEQNYVVTYTYIDSTGKIHYDYRDLSGSDSGNFLTGYTQTKDGKISVSKGTFETTAHQKNGNYVITYAYINSAGKLHYDYRDLSGTDSGNFLTGYTQSADGKISVSKGTFGALEGTSYTPDNEDYLVSGGVIIGATINSDGKLSYVYRNLSGNNSGDFLYGFRQDAHGKVSIYEKSFANSYKDDGKSNIISYTSSSPLKTVSYTYIDSNGKVHQTYNSIYIDPVNDFKYHDLGITQVTYQGDENFVYALTGVSTTNGNATSHTIAYQISGLPTKKYVDDQFRANDALRYCGTVTPSTNPNGTITFTHTTGTHPGHSNPDYDAGAVYKVNGTGYIFSERVSAGDMMISYWDNDLNRNLSIDGWNIINQNIDLRTISPENKYFNNSKSANVLTGVYLTNDGTLSYSYYSLSVKTNTDKYTAASEVENNGAQNILRNGGNKRGLKVLTGVSLTQNGLETEISYSYTYLYSEQQHHSTEGSAGPSIGIDNNGTKVITDVNLSADGKLTYMYNTISIDESTHASSSVGLDSVVKSGANSGILTNLYVDSSNQNKLTYVITNATSSKEQSSGFIYKIQQNSYGIISADGRNFATEGHEKTNNQSYVITYTYIDSTGKLHYDYRNLTGSDSGNFLTGYTQSADGKISVSKGTFGTNKASSATTHTAYVVGVSMGSDGKLSYNYAEVNHTNTGTAATSTLVDSFTSKRFITAVNLTKSGEFTFTYDDVTFGITHRVKNVSSNDKIYLTGVVSSTNNAISYQYFNANTYTTNGAFYTTSAIIGTDINVGGQVDVSNSVNANNLYAHDGIYTEGTIEAEGNLIVGGNTILGDESTDSITLNAASITLSNNTKFTNLSNLWGSV